MKDEFRIVGSIGWFIAAIVVTCVGINSLISYKEALGLFDTLWLNAWSSWIALLVLFIQLLAVLYIVPFIILFYHKKR